MRERSQGRRKPRGGDFRSVAEKILPRTLDVVTRITLYGKAAALWVVASACFLAKERFRDKPSGKPLFLKGLLRTGGSCTQRGGKAPFFSSSSLCCLTASILTVFTKEQRCFVFRRGTIFHAY